MKSSKLAPNAAYFSAIVRTKELLLAYEAAAAAAESASLSRTGMFEAVYDAAEAYDEGFERLCAIREARDTKSINGAAHAVSKAAGITSSSFAAATHTFSRAAGIKAASFAAAQNKNPKP